MKRVLVLVDLEGVAPVASIAALCYGQRRYRNACRALTSEVLAVCQGLRQRGVEQILISDSHRGGSPEGNLELERLPDCRVLSPGRLPFQTGSSGLEVAYWDDAMDALLFQGVEAVVALGMHSRAGTPAFAAHTVAPHCAWSWQGREVGELEIFLGLTAEADIPLVLVSGDSHLLADLDPLIASRFVVTKTSVVSSDEHGSFFDSLHCRDSLTVCEELRAAAASHTPVVPPLPQGNGGLRLIGKSLWACRDFETGTPHATRIAQGTHGTPGIVASVTSWREEYNRCLQLVQSTADPGLQALVRLTRRGHDGVELVSEMLRRPFPGPVVSWRTRLGGAETIDLWATEELQRRTDLCLAAFERLTADDGEYALSLKALVLMIARRWTPNSFQRLGLDGVWKETRSKLEEVALKFSLDLPADLAMARMDAFYICWLTLDESSSAQRPIDEDSLWVYLRHLRHQGQTTFAWVIESLYRRTRSQEALSAPDSNSDGLDPLYLSAHEIFFASDYFTKPLELTSEYKLLIEEFYLQIPGIIEREMWDVGAEVTLCLLQFGEWWTSPTQQLLSALLRAQSDTGELTDQSAVDQFSDLADHATGLLFLILAKMEEISILSRYSDEVPQQHNFPDLSHRQCTVHK